MKYAWLVMVLLLFGCKSAKQAFVASPAPEEPIACDNVRYSDNDLSMAALNVIHPLVVHCNYGPACSEERVKEGQQKVASLREWANTIESETVRTAYVNWLNYYDGKYEEQLRVLRERASGKTQAETEHEARARELQRASDRAEALARCLPKPQ